MSNLCAKCLTRIEEGRTHCKNCDDSARGMFERIGYKRVENHPKEEKDNYTFTTQDNPYIKYYEEDEKAYEEIVFDLWGKRVWCKAYRKDLGLNVPCPINMKELQAINKQVEELGWNNE